MTYFSAPALLLHTQCFCWSLVKKQSELTAFQKPFVKLQQSCRVAAESQDVSGGNLLRAGVTPRFVDAVAAAAALTVNQTNLEGVGTSRILFSSQKSMPTSFFSPDSSWRSPTSFLFHETHLIGGRKAKPQ